MTILRAKNISKSFGRFSLLKNVHLEVGKSQSIAICGKSGAGKTTLLHILGTLEDADSGEIFIKEQAVTKNMSAKVRNQEIGFVFQSYNLLEDFTVLDNVLMPAKIGRLPCDRAKGLALLAQVGLQDKAELPAKVLSGGERQRVAIARALCNNPSLILADEPTGNLDKANAKKVGELLLSLEVSLILVTHDSELASLCNKRYVLSDGKLE